MVQCYIVQHLEKAIVQDLWTFLLINENNTTYFFPYTFFTAKDPLKHFTHTLSPDF